MSGFQFSENHLAQRFDNNQQLGRVLDRQLDLAYFPQVNWHVTPPTENRLTASSNEEIWAKRQELYATRWVTLEHFHLFEWFPLAPGRFHTPEGRESREITEQTAMRLNTPDGLACYDPYGKMNMILGGIGTVHLNPRLLKGEDHFFMTASSSGVCHEGFPVLVPHSRLTQVMPRIHDEGAAPVTLAGEMRNIPKDLLTFTGNPRDLPPVYLHVQDLKPHAQPRQQVSSYRVSVALIFEGEVQSQRGLYTTYASFDPSLPDGLLNACRWLQDMYVVGQYQGEIITDFDEVENRFPNFPDAVFGMPGIMSGRLDRQRVERFVRAQQLSMLGMQGYIENVTQIRTDGGAYIAGNVTVNDGGKFVGRDEK